MDKLIYRRRETTANTAKNKINLRASTRTVQKYLKKLGWKKITIFIDECTVMMNKNARTQWFRNSLAGETKSGLRPKYKHVASIHLIRDATEQK